MSARTIWHNRESERESDGVRTSSDASSTGLTECFESCDLSDFSSLTWLAILFFILDDARLMRSVDHWRRSSFTVDGDQGPVSCSSSIICWPTDASPHRLSIPVSLPTPVRPHGSMRWYLSDHHWTWTAVLPEVVPLRPPLSCTLPPASSHSTSDAVR